MCELVYHLNSIFTTAQPFHSHILYYKQRYEVIGPTLGAHEETYTYWEPADTVNDLHEQLSSNKYRELLPEQVK